MSKKNTNQKRVLILGNSRLVVFGFRGELIKELVAHNYDVWVCFPNGPFGEGEVSAKEYGCHFIENHIDRRGTNIFRDMSLISEYKKILKSVSPDIVLAYTVKPDVYGGIICDQLHIPFVPNITGLGKGLTDGGVVQKVTIALYKKAIKNAVCVFFQNDEDKRFFDSHRISYKNGIVLPGSGVNLQKYIPLDYPGDNDPVRFVYVARVMKAKGIEQYLEAAHVLKAKYPDTEFHICGFCEENYKKTLLEREQCGEIKYHGLVDDVREIEKNCHCVVLPTFHPEGISNVLLEGAACARPLIATDRPGCKEAVKDGVTGFLVKEKDSNDLMNKMETFINLSNDKRRAMGLAGRKKVEKEFDRKIVVDNYMSIIKRI